MTTVSVLASVVAIALAVTCAFYALKTVRIANRRIKLTAETSDLRLSVVSNINTFIQGQREDETMSSEMNSALDALNDAVGRSMVSYAD